MEKQTNYVIFQLKKIKKTKLLIIMIYIKIVKLNLTKLIINLYKFGTK